MFTTSKQLLCNDIYPVPEQVTTTNQLTPSNASSVLLQDMANVTGPNPLMSYLLSTITITCGAICFFATSAYVVYSTFYSEEEQEQEKASENGYLGMIMRSAGNAWNTVSIKYKQLSDTVCDTVPIRYKHCVSRISDTETILHDYLGMVMRSAGNAWNTVSIKYKWRSDTAQSTGTKGTSSQEHDGNRTSDLEKKEHSVPEESSTVSSTSSAENGLETKQAAQLNASDTNNKEIVEKSSDGQQQIPNYGLGEALTLQPDASDISNKDNKQSVDLADQHDSNRTLDLEEKEQQQSVPEESSAVSSTSSAENGLEKKQAAQLNTSDTNNKDNEQPADPISRDDSNDTQQLSVSEESPAVSSKSNKVKNISLLGIVGFGSLGCYSAIYTPNATMLLPGLNISLNYSHLAAGLAVGCAVVALTAWYYGSKKEEVQLSKPNTGVQDMQTSPITNTQEKRI